MKNKKKYSGALNEPMMEFTYPAGSYDGLRIGKIGKDARSNDIKEEMSKLLLLAKHYEIDGFPQIRFASDIWDAAQKQTIQRVVEICLKYYAPADMYEEIEKEFSSDKASDKTSE